MRLCVCVCVCLRVCVRDRDFCYCVEDIFLLIRGKLPMADRLPIIHLRLAFLLLATHEYPHLGIMDGVCVCVCVCVCLCVCVCVCV